jgi:hypothetical protein
MKKKIFLLSIIAVLAFAVMGCDNGGSLVKSGGDTPEGGNPQPCGGLLIYAQVENASEFNNIVEVRLIIGGAVVARGDWKGDGFTIILPKTLDPNHLHTLIDSPSLTMAIPSTPSILTISNKNVNVVTPNFAGVDKNDNVVSYFFPFKIDKDGNARGAFYTYVDSNLTIFGYTEREGVIYTEYDIELFRGTDIMRVWWNKITTTYSVEWKAGWNVWGLSRVYPSGGIGIVTEEWSSTPFSELRWYGGEDLWNLLLTH